MIPRATLLLLFSLALSPLAAADPGDRLPAQPVIPGRTFNLGDFGAVPDGVTLNTQAFKRAVAAVDHAGGGTLEVPPGIFFTGPVNLCSRINLHLEAGAKILFSPDPEDYREGTASFRPLLLASGVHDVMISGAGAIDGHGDAWWPAARKFRDEANARGQGRNNVSPRPLMVAFENCSRVRVEGVSLENSPEHALAPIRSENVSIVGVSIFNPEDTPNTDGIDPSSCRRVLIARCRIDTGDDCIAVKAEDTTAGVSEDILVTDCAFLHGHGCSIGSVTSGGLRNMTVRRCTFDGTDTGIRLKSFRNFGGLVEHITYADLRMRNVGQAITISCSYVGTTVDSAGVGDVAEPVTAATPHWRNITIRNVTATACTLGAGLIQGLPEMPVEDVTLEHVSIEAPRGLIIVDASGVTLNDVHVTARAGPPLLVKANVSGLTQQ
jgi:polygalacturonase